MDANVPERDHAFVRMDLELRIIDPAALEAAALADIRSRDYLEPVDAEDDEEFVRGGPEEALSSLLDALAVIQPTVGVELVSSAVGPYSPKPPQESRPLAEALRAPASHDEYILQLVKDSERAKGLDDVFDDLAGVDDEGVEDPVEMQLGVPRWQVFRGLLWQASITLVDELFADIVALGFDGGVDVGFDSGAAPVDIENTWVLSSLPRRHAHRYDSSFARRFLVAAVDITSRLTSEWRAPSSVAQELALRCLLDQVEFSTEILGVDVGSEWRSMLEDLLFEDLDHEFLYSDSFDGFENDPEFGPPGMMPMGFESWFVPFDAELSSGSPYALDESR